MSRERILVSPGVTGLGLLLIWSTIGGWSAEPRTGPRENAIKELWNRFDFGGFDMISSVELCRPMRDWEL